MLDRRLASKYFELDAKALLASELLLPNSADVARAGARRERTRRFDAGVRIESLRACWPFADAGEQITQRIGLIAHSLRRYSSSFNGE